MANTIQEYVNERDIRCLVHFTRERNLDSILDRGLVPRNILESQGYTDFNDQYRRDGTNAVCVSIGFPNYRMFYRIRQEDKDCDWVILVIDPSALWLLPCAFCVTNAATSIVTAIPLAKRKDLSSFQAMYADWGEKTRELLNINKHLPTNPQAEVLMLDGVPKEYIFCVLVANNAKQRELKTRYPSLDIRSYPGYFSARTDFLHWKQEP